jgi:hypothetical protein
MANVLTTIEIRADAGRTREEIVASLQAATDAAKQTAAEFDRLKQKSVEETAAVNKLSQELGALQLRMSQTRSSQAEVSSQMTFFNKEAASSRQYLKALEADLAKVTQAQMMMGKSASGNTEQAVALRVEETRLNKAINETTTALIQHSGAIAQLKGRTAELVTAEQTLQRGIHTTRATLLDEREALLKTNEAKQRAALETQRTAQALREATGEARQFNQTIREQTREVDRLNTTQAALAVTIGNLLSSSIRSALHLFKDLIVEVTIYAARTDELGIVMTKLAQVNGISTGEITAQERAIRNLNIATQDTRQVLAQFVASQLELSKASQLARVAQDLAVISGTDSADSFRRLTQGIETLQIRTLRTAGVFVGLDGILDKAAKTSGRTRDSFSEQEKQALLLNEVLDFGARVTGTYEEAMNNAGKQMRSLTRIIGDAKNAVGSLTVFQATFQLIVSGIKMVLEVIQAAPAAILVLVGAFLALGATFVSNIPAIETWTSKLVGAQGQLTIATRSTLGFGAAQRKAGMDALAAAEMHTQANNVINKGSATATTPLTKTTAFRGSVGIGAGVGLGAGAASYAATGDIDSAIGTGLAVGAGTAATTALLAGATAASGGLLLLVAAIGAVVYGLVKYANAQKNVTYANEEDMRLMVNRIKVNKEDAKSLREQAGAIENTNNAYLRNSDEVKMSHMALTRLTFQTQQDIKNKVEQTRSTDTLSQSSARAVTQLRLQADALEQVNTQQAKSLAGKQAINIIGIEQSVENIKEYGKEMEYALGLLQKMDKNFSTGDKQSAEGAGWIEWAQNKYNTAFKENEIAVQQQQNAYKQMAETFDQLAPKTSVFTDATEESVKAQKLQIREFAIAEGWIKRENKNIEEHVGHVYNFVNAKRAAVDAQNSERGMRASYTKQLGELNIKEVDFTKTSVFMARSVSQVAGQLDSSSRVIDKNGKAVLTWRERLGASRDNLLSLDETIKGASRNQGEYNAAIEAIGAKYPQIVSAIRELRGEVQSSIEGIGEDVGRANERFNSAKASLLSTVREIRGSLGRPTDEAAFAEQQAAQLELMSSRLSVVKSQIDSIQNSRINLGLDTAENIPETREARDDLQHTLDMTLRLRDAIRESQRAAKDFVYQVAEAQAIATTGIVSAEMIAAKTIAENQRQRLQGEQELTARIIELSYERERRFKDESGEQRLANQSYMIEQLEDLQKVREEQSRTAAALSFGSRGASVANLPQFNLPGGGNLRDIDVPTPEQVQALTATQQTAESTTQTALNTQNMPQTLTSLLPPAIGSSLTPLFNNVTTGLDSLGTRMAEELAKLGTIVQTQAPGSEVYGEYEDARTGGTTPDNVAAVIRKRAAEIGFNQNIAQSQLIQESGGKLRALSPAGAGGAFQIMPKTEEYLVPQLKKRGINVNVGDRWGLEGGSYMWQQHMLNSMNSLKARGINPEKIGQVEFDKLVVAAYNTGDGNVSKAMRRTGANTFSGIQSALLPETQKYVPSIFNRAGIKAPTFAQATIKKVADAPVRTPSNQELLKDRIDQLRTEVSDGRSKTSQEVNGGFAPIEYYKQLREAQKANYDGLINDSRQLRMYVSAEEQAWRASNEYKVASDNKVARNRAETFRTSQDELATLDSEDRLRVRQSAIYRQTITNQVELARRKDFNQTFDELQRQREEDSQRNANSEQYRQTITMKFESARRQEFNKTRERIIELNAEVDTNWRQSAEYRQMLDSKVAINRRDSLLAAREALDMLNREDNSHPEVRERQRIEAEIERRKQVQATSDEIQKLNDLEDQGWFNSIEYRQMLNNRFEISRRQESLKTRDSIYTHQLEIANHDETMRNRMAEAYDKASTRTQDLDDAATLSMIDNMRTIEDNQTVSLVRVEAGLVGWMAKQRGMTDIVTDAMTQTLDAAFSGIDKLIGKVTDKAGAFGDVMKGILGGFIKMGLTNIIGQLSGAGQETQAQGKGFFDQILGTFAGGNVRDQQSVAPLAPMHVPQMFVSQLYVGGSVGGGLGGASGAFGGFGGSVPGTGLNTSTLGLNPSAPGGTGTFSGNPITFNGGNANSNFPATTPFGNMFGGYRTLPADLARQGGTSIGNMSEPGSSSFGSSLGSQVAGMIPGVGSSVATTGVQAASRAAAQGTWASRMGGNNWGGVGGFQSGIGASIAGMLPGIGGSLGGMLGGQSPLGSMMGQVGGLALGGVGMAALMGQTAVAGMFGGGAFGGAVAGLLTNPITAVVGGALLIGAVLLGRNKRRREEEKVRDKALGDAKTQMAAILKNVQRNRLDGAAGIAQAEEIRSQYMASMSQLKDSKTRNHALATVRELDALISQIKGAAAAQERRREFNDSLVPEFAGGGIVQSTGAGMVVPGVDMGYDTVPAMLRPGEVVLNKQQQAALGGAPAMAAARVPGFVRQTAIAARRYADGGIASNSMPTVSTSGMSASAGNGGNIYVVMDKKFAQDMMVAGRDKIIEMSASDVRDKGKIYSAVRKTR